MKVVWKFPLEDNTEMWTLHLPAEAIGIHVLMQEDRPVLYVEVPLDEALQSPTVQRTKKPTIDKKFQCVASGQPIPSQWNHCGTVVDGPYVWHIYEVIA